MTDVDPWHEHSILTARGWGALGAAERRLVAVGDLRAQVNNGGFEQYFFNSSGDHVADAIEGLMRGGAAEPADRDARQDALEALAPDVFEHVDDAWFALEASRDLDPSADGHTPDDL